MLNTELGKKHFDLNSSFNVLNLITVVTSFKVHLKSVNIDNANYFPQRMFKIHSNNRSNSALF